MQKTYRINTLIQLLLIVFVAINSTAVLADDKIKHDQPSFQMTLTVTKGHWQHAGKHGYYQFVVNGEGFEHIKTKLTVNWIVNNSNSVNDEIFRSISIKELNDPPYYSFELPECIPDTGCASFFINATHTYAHTQHLINISLNDDGSYIFKIEDQ